MRWSHPVAILVCLALSSCSRPTKRSDHHASTSASAAPEVESFGRLSIEQVGAKIKDAQAGRLQLYLFDTNDKTRFTQSHLPGANWLDHDNIQPASFPTNKNATLVFYCGNEL